ncbi:MAG: TonB-dependent siderophore receptor [Neptunomonas phycophila]|uniref:TonB-dependent siderophore receptor n=2 Tax=Neptunomonas phycophila TaxID=1572645 RepID=UPI003B8C89F4
MPLRARAPFLHQSKPLSVLLCISGVFGSSLSAMAETQTAEQTSEIVLAPLSVVGDKVGGSTAATNYEPVLSSSLLHSNAQLLDVPQAINIIPAQAMEDQRPKNLDDALINVSGITQGNTLGSTLDSVMKRGFGGNRDGSIMRNGAPVVQGRSLNATAESVEVLKGPASLLYGVMDPGGVINVVSKQPQLTNITNITVGTSSFGDGKGGNSATLDSTGQLGNSNFAYRLIMDAVDEDYWRNFGEREEQLIAPSIRWYGDKTDVTVSYEYREFLYPSDRGTILDPTTNKPLAIPAVRRLDEPANTMEGRSQLFQTSIDHYFNDDWKLHAGYSYNRETYDANQLRVTGIDVDSGTLTRRNSATHDALSTDSFATIYLNGKFDTAGMKNDLLVGVDHEYRRYYRENLLRDSISGTFDYLNPVYGTVGGSTTVSDSASDQTDKLKSTSAFFQDTLYLTDQWLLVLGARYMTYDQLAGRGRPFQANTDLSGNAFLPRVGVVFKATPEWSLYASYTESLKPNSTIAPKAGIVIDSSIQPEESKSFEVGAKFELDNGVTGTVAVFDINKKNILVSEYNETTAESSWRTSGQARSRGIELDIAGKVTDRLDVIASYAYIDGETTEDPEYKGNRLWNVAEQTASVSTRYKVDDALRLGGSVHYVGDRAGDSANTFTLPSYTTTDVFATYETRFQDKDLTWQLNIKNLFDKVYYPSATNKYFVSIGDSRQVMLSAKLAF